MIMAECMRRGFLCGKSAGCAPHIPFHAHKHLQRLTLGLPLCCTADVLICSVGTEVFYNTCSPTVRLLLAQAGQQQGQPQGLGLGLEEEAGQEAGPGAGPTSTAAADTAPAAEEACEAARQRACFQPDRAWEAKLEEGWDVERVRALVAHHFPHLAKQVSA